MPKYDVTDEAVIDASPTVVYEAILDEYAGVTNWWMPILEFKLRGNTPIDHEGAMGDMISKGAKCSFKVTKIEEAESIEMDISGDLMGTGTWTFEPTDGKTKVKYRSNVRTNKALFSLVSPFVNFGKTHSDNVQRGFKALNSYLTKKSTG
jgi:uncharacterized protein YndB with AHSA1/START domain